MSRLLCCLRARQPDMGAALSHSQEGEACDGAGQPAAPPTMADVIRERKKKAGGAALGTLRRKLANAARRPRDNRPDRGCEHARLIRSVVGSWRPAEVWVLCEELQAGAALRDLATQAELAREPAPALHAALPALYGERWWCDVEVCGCGWSLPAHRAILAARSDYFRELLQRHPPSCVRLPLEGACASLSRAEADAALLALYGGGTTCQRHKFESHDHADGDLDLVDNTNSCPGGSCACSVRGGAARRAAGLLGVTTDPLHTSMRYLLDSGEMCDAKLVFRVEGGSGGSAGGAGGSYGFRTTLELPCHRVVLAARSRFFRSVMSRRPSSSNSSGVVCVDEKVLPRRFARALLHAAYTDQVDLSLIGRNTSLPATTTTTGSTSWVVGGGRSGGARLTPAGLEDAFTLYEIARFLEMPIVVQGCEDAIVESLTPDTLPHVLRWGTAPHASQWVHRQAMRYLRDEFVTILSSSSAGSIPASALASALASPFLQASETAALRALLRWGTDHKNKQREAGAAWGASGARRGGRRRSLSDAALRDTLAPLLQHVRLEHIPPDNELLNQLVRRGILPPPGEVNSAHAWLGRGSYRPARCFLPYLDEIKALLEEQAVPEAEIARARRARNMHRIPDTLYMVVPAVAAPAPAPAAVREARACVGGRAGAALRARARELRAAPPARAAAALRHRRPEVHRQVALRAVREMSLPDACAELLLDDMDDGCESPPAPESPRPPAWPDSCCRSQSVVSSRVSGSQARGQDTTDTTLSCDSSRSGTCPRREQTARADTAQNRLSGGRLSAAVPDVAMAPNANTHLLTARDYFRHPPPWEYGGVVLQLDLGDGATHTPRPGSRAQRNSAAAQHNTRQREHAHVSQAPPRPDPDELRAAIELSVMRAYSSFHGRSPPRRRGAAATLPPPLRAELLPAHASPRPRGPRPAPPHLALPLASPSPSPSARRRDYTHDYRLEAGSYGGSASTSRGHSPNNYA